MADVFISYKKEDRALAERVEAALQGEGITSWWDTSLHPRESWDAIIQREIAEAAAVIVIWTSRSVHSEWVRIEANYGKQHKKLVPLLAEPCNIPLAFSLTQAAQVTDWDGTAGHGGWRQALVWIGALLVEDHGPDPMPSTDNDQAPVQPTGFVDPAIPSAAVTKTADSEDRKAAFASIDQSRLVEDYRRFLERFPHGAEAFEADGRLDQLQSWSKVDHDDPAAIDSWFIQYRAGVFPSLAAEARRVQKRARKARRGSSKLLAASGVSVVVAATLGSFWYFDLMGLRENAGGEEFAEVIDLVETPGVPGADEHSDPLEGDFDAADQSASAPVTSPSLGGTISGEVSYGNPAPGVFEPYAPGDSFRDCAECPEMAVIPAGAFTMGGGPWGDSYPIREMQISYDFAISKYEITRAQFEEFISQADYRPTDQCEIRTADLGSYQSYRVVPPDGFRFDNPGVEQAAGHPVVCVTWNDAVAYVDWLSEETGFSYRLPSEAEWEYSARAGTDTDYFFGNDVNDICEYANGDDFPSPQPYTSRNLVCDDGFEATAPVGSYAPNQFGLYDILGNAAEWTADCYRSSYSTAASTDGSAWETANCRWRSIRGGAFTSPEVSLGVATRKKAGIQDAYNYVGFRVARVL